MPLLRPLASIDEDVALWRVNAIITAFGQLFANVARRDIFISRACARRFGSLVRLGSDVYLVGCQWASVTVIVGCPRKKTFDQCLWVWAVWW